jgi:two-component system chemotaxis response regulator CheV
MNDRIILVLDFEKIVAELCSESALKPLDSVIMARSATNPERALKTILVADDSLFIRKTLCSSLRSAGYSVVEAENGSEAWNIIQQTLLKVAQEGGTFQDYICMMITDVEMPQMDGLHLTSLVRKEDSLREFPVAIFSSLASEDNKRKWIGLGANCILTKPDLPKLVTVVDELTA